MLGLEKSLHSSEYTKPGSPPSEIYEAPTPGSGWSNTPGGNYSEAGTPRNSSSAYANAPSPYFPSTPGGQPPDTKFGIPTWYTWGATNVSCVR
ncbi:hypothetical protein AgCh_022788 [Apium graveolens]